RASSHPLASLASACCPRVVSGPLGRDADTCREQRERSERRRARTLAGAMSEHRANVVDVTDATFEQVVVEGSRERPVVVDLWAEWCGPCRTLGPILEKIAEERDGAFLLAKLDTDANPMTSAAFGVQSIPTVIAFRDGKAITGFIGAYPEPAVNEFVDTLLPTEAE